jgi:hypothetical protein
MDALMVLLVKICKDLVKKIIRIKNRPSNALI